MESIGSYVASLRFILSVYVGGLLVIGLGEDIDGVVKQVKTKFELKDLGPVHNLLDMPFKTPEVPGTAAANRNLSAMK
ncbi:hypothetical protein PybrP1_006709 [[Pythium] brassicae (nom. inval.)]|nr:hypothetical protein PybrP1_006709 [[Pythium] brassicae (nom. inval.)]